MRLIKKSSITEYNDVIKARKVKKLLKTVMEKMFF